MYILIVISVLTHKFDIDDVNSLHQVSNVNDTIEPKVWHTYFQFYFSSLTEKLDISDTPNNMNVDYFPQPLLNRFHFDFNQNINTRWMRASCPQLHWSLYVTIEYLYDIIKPNRDISLIKLDAIRMLRYKDNIINDKFEVNKCRSINYTPGDNNATLCEKDIAYGWDGNSWWFIYTTQVTICLLYNTTIL